MFDASRERNSFAGFFCYIFPFSHFNGTRFIIIFIPSSVKRESNYEFEFERMERQKLEFIFIFNYSPVGRSQIVTAMYINPSAARGRRTVVTLESR